MNSIERDTLVKKKSASDKGLCYFSQKQDYKSQYLKEMKIKTIILPTLFTLALLTISSFTLKGSTSSNELNDFKTNVNRFVTNYSNKYDTIVPKRFTSATAHSLDKGNYIWHRNLQFTPKDQSKVTEEESFSFLLKAYYFVDSTSCQESFNLWMNNFGSYAVPLKIGVNYKNFATTPILSLKTERIILYFQLESSIIKKNVKQTKKKFKVKLKSTHYILELDSECGGPILWK
jgi:hypothetical protein